MTRLISRAILSVPLACAGDKVTPDPGDSADPEGDAPGVVVLAGGGTEADEGDAQAWSARAYGALLEGGDVTGDGLVRVAVLSDGEETDWVPGYFEWLGADEAFNLQVDSREAAADASITAAFADVDAAFLKGGDQGVYYDLWNDTALEEALLALAARGGGLGGTSAGAMSQAGYALAGGMDYVSADALADAHTEWLDDDSDGGSGIHADFLGTVPDTLIDTHFAVRGRLGRLAGAMARAIDEGAPRELLGVGLDEQTALVIRGDRAEVVGVGSVVFLRAGGEGPTRVAGEPLVWADLRLDRLTDGWFWDMAAGAPDTEAPPDGAEPVSWDGAVQDQDAEDWEVDGARRVGEESFEWVIERWPDPYALVEGLDELYLRDAMGLLNAHDSGMRGVNDEVGYRALYDQPGATLFLVGEGGVLRRDASAPEQIQLNGDGDTPLATLVLDARGASWRSLSPEVSLADAGDGGLRAAGLVGLRLHVLYSDGTDGRVWKMATAEPVHP